jgi:hypothetical protein
MNNSGPLVLALAKAPPKLYFEGTPFSLRWYGKQAAIFRERSSSQKTRSYAKYVAKYRIEFARLNVPVSALTIQTNQNSPLLADTRIQIGRATRKGSSPRNFCGRRWILLDKRNLKCRVNRQAARKVFLLGRQFLPTITVSYGIGVFLPDFRLASLGANWRVIPRFRIKR